MRTQSITPNVLPREGRCISRRSFLRLAGWAAALLAPPAAWWYADELEPQWLAVEYVHVRLPRLPSAWNGLRLAQISDLHIGPATPASLTHAALDLTLGLRPDLVALTGDYVSHLASGEAEQLTGELARLTAPLGVYGVLGNHDHWTNAEQVAEAVSRAGVILLRNTHVRLEREGGSLYLAGVDDVWERQADLAAALAGVPADGCVILLAHEPDFADAVAADGRVALQLSGHSHGGQVRLPGIGPVVLPYLGQKYPCGLQAVNGLQVYTNRGVGMIKPDVRFNCRPEVTLVTLERV